MPPQEDCALKLSLSLVMGLVGAFSTANAAPISYDINFTGGSPNPTSGSFTYDDAAPAFSNFFVSWNSITYDLTTLANSPFLQGACNTVAPDARDFFAILSGGCGGGSRAWQANSTQDPTIFLMGVFANPGGDVAALATAPTAVGIFTAGEFTITATPEPSGAAFMLLGAGALAATRFRRNRTLPN